MEFEKKIKTLQTLYAAALADSTLRYGRAGILEDITGQKREEQMKNGASLAQRFGVKEARQAFEKIQDIYGCANWVCEDVDNGFTAKCTNCILCVFSKQMGTYSPCQVHCLSPIEAMVKSVEPGADFTVEKTLWDGDACVVTVSFNR